MSELKEVFTNIYQNWGFGGDESRSGPGSSLDETEKIRNQIRKLVHEKNIKTVVDIPCGDFNWMQHVDRTGIHYIGSDIVEPLIESNKKKHPDVDFRHLDLTKSELPQVDLIIARDVFVHMCYELIGLN